MTLRLEYEQVLKSFLNYQGELDLMRAYELGKQFQNQQTSPDELIGIHMEALDSLSPDLSETERLNEVMHSFSVLLEMMIAYGIAYSDAYRLITAAAREAEDAKFELERTIVDLDLANQQLQDMDRIKTQFFSNMSHELRTPLNSIIGFADDALDGMAGELTPKQKRYVSNILGAGKHLLTVINDILDLAKLAAGKVMLELEAIPVREVLQEVADMLEPMLQRKQQTLDVDVTPDVDCVHADRSKLFQILLNLGSNAHKFSAAEGAIKLRAYLDGKFVAIEVQDNGIGIAQEQIPLLFEEFIQVATKHPASQPGTGLGLPITKRLVELHGGTIEASSELGKGTTFCVRLPAEACQA